MKQVEYRYSLLNERKNTKHGHNGYGNYPMPLADRILSSTLIIVTLFTGVFITAFLITCIRNLMDGHLYG
ncbi:hypothetical protein Leryth_001695 [Lithospermum erythrorhizon]|nr:hypothetical protein Leryth_001695 [Lithospermum erythrorhizon]